MKSQILKAHSFPTKVWEKCRELNPAILESDRDKESDAINEYEFYVLRVGYALAHLVTWIEQLEHAVFYLSDYPYSKAAKSYGITSASHLQYNVENYLIRLNSIYDRSLQLTNCVFHLCVEESNISHALIVSNLHVARTKVPLKLKSLRKSLDQYAQYRHKILHQSSYQDSTLRRLELFYMYDKEAWETAGKKSKFANLAHVRSQLLKKTVASLKMDYSQINDSLGDAIADLFVPLEREYERQTRRISAYLQSDA